MTQVSVVALVCAFAVGAAVVLSAQDYQRGAASCQVPKGSAVIDPAPALHHSRESWALTHPLECDGPWVKNCPDFKPCAPVCLAARVHDPRPLGLEVERDLKHVR